MESSMVIDLDLIAYYLTKIQLRNISIVIYINNWFCASYFVNLIYEYFLISKLRFVTYVVIVYLFSYSMVWDLNKIQWNIVTQFYFF